MNGTNAVYTLDGNIIDYSVFVDALAKPGADILTSLTPAKCHLLHMALGAAGEVGELVDAIKKHVLYGKELDIENVVEELGDLNFYVQGIQSALAIADTQIIAANSEKLGKRYAQGYSDKAAQERADKQEPQEGGYVLAAGLETQSLETPEEIVTTMRIKIKTS